MISTGDLLGKGLLEHPLNEYMLHGDRLGNLFLRHKLKRLKRYMAGIPLPKTLIRTCRIRRPALPVLVNPVNSQYYQSSNHNECNSDNGAKQIYLPVGYMGADSLFRWKCELRLVQLLIVFKIV
jgi:hypothetical protein